MNRADLVIGTEPSLQARNERARFFQRVIFAA